MQLCKWTHPHTYCPPFCFQWSWFRDLPGPGKVYDPCDPCLPPSAWESQDTDGCSEATECCWGSPRRCAWGLNNQCCTSFLTSSYEIPHNRIFFFSWLRRMPQWLSAANTLISKVWLTTTWRRQCLSKQILLASTMHVPQPSLQNLMHSSPVVQMCSLVLRICIFMLIYWV